MLKPPDWPTYDNVNTLLSVAGGRRPLCRGIQLPERWLEEGGNVISGEHEHRHPGDRRAPAFPVLTLPRAHTYAWTCRAAVYLCSRSVNPKSPRWPSVCGSVYQRLCLSVRLCRSFSLFACMSQGKLIKNKLRSRFSAWVQLIFLTLSYHGRQMFVRQETIANNSLGMNGVLAN